MKTTVEISDSLLEEARKVAARRRRGGAFRLRKASFKGKGLQPGAAGASWERLREMAYEARGG